MTLQDSGVNNQSVVRRVLQSSSWIGLGALASQGMRLAGNLVLTRLLFPEAFGLMALVTMFIVGAKMFSDLGIRPWIQKDHRGDDPVFLDTAWTLQVARGVILWGLSCVMAWPVANFFDEPLLATILPIAGLELIAAGLMPTRIATAHRHLQVGRVTQFELLGQAGGLLFTLLLAWQLQSVWALVWGSLASSLMLLILMQLGLPGHKNRLLWNSKAATELITFGKWIFFSTICGFIVAQGDKIILGKFLSAEALGIYTIGFFLASFPVMLTQKVSSKVLIPLYREHPPAASPQNFAKIRKLRFAVTAGLFALLILLSLLGPHLVELLYDVRYATSGVILVLVACAQMPLAVGLTYTHAALAHGNSRQFFMVTLVKAALMLSLMLSGTYFFGMVGAIGGQAAAHFLSLPAIIWLARTYRAWDGLHDMVFLGLMVAFGSAAIWIHRSDILALIQTGVGG
ncbi:oligosaccharide flippase family protein [Sulfitobacter sp. S0837]|uniref:oligosaccharide flippase family protein n=1 Tax=Sulfitobacter maritimus TaxID=2741719 RepID=UPI0015820AE9|nr:oligosaccharide flippase family protein [Sulfitobacter maritimus]NUH65499.1 oligosaccharide flippase family protein [Sulfitobacter maritimus]